MQQWWLDTGNRSLQELDIYVVRRDGTFHHQSASSNAPFSARPLTTGFFVFPVKLLQGEPAEIYLRARSTGWLPVSLAPAIWKPDKYAEKLRSHEVQWLVYVGMGLALGLFNLLLFVALRDGSYLWYVISLMSMVWVASSGYGAYGLAFKFLWPESPKFEQFAWIASILGSGFFPAMFVMRFVQGKDRLPRLYRAWSILLGLFVVSGLARAVLALAPALLPVPIQQHITVAGRTALVLFVILGIGGVLVLAWQGQRSARMIALAWSPISIAGMLAVYLESTLGLLMWASACEFVLMSLVLADKFVQERRERELAQAALVEGLQRSERELAGKVRERTDELEQEQLRTTQLLHNILPVNVADELRRTGTARPQRHESVTILFSDFSGFTQAVSTMPAHRMVAELDEIFGAFDRVADECGVEKIKTIGDAYMAVAGLEGGDDHAERCVRMALLMIDYVRERNERAAFKWELRVGAHSGPVVSGVVGHSKYAFDIWGDSVNIAARMESSGEVGRANISAYTFDLVRERFQCTYRGKVDAKGKGAVDMYFVDAPIAVANQG